MPKQHRHPAGRTCGEITATIAMLARKTAR